MNVAHYATIHSVDDLFVLEQHLALQGAWVLPHDAQVLVLDDLVDPHLKTLGDGNTFGLLRWFFSWHTWIDSHREGARWDVGQLEFDVVSRIWGVAMVGS
jgi:hypothetical protein